MAKSERHKKIRRAYYLLINLDLVLKTKRDVYYREFKAIKEELGFAKLKDVCDAKGNPLI